MCVAFLIMTRKQSDEKLRITVKWLAVLIFSVLCAAAFGVLQRQQQIDFSNAYDNEFMVITLTVSSLLLFIAGVIKDGKNLKDVFKYGFLCGCRWRGKRSNEFLGFVCINPCAYIIYRAYENGNRYRNIIYYRQANI